MLKKISLTTWIFFGLFLGIFAGLIFGERIVPWASPLGDIFLRLLRMTIIPLIITSILSGVLSIGSGKGLGRLGLKTFAYYTTTSLLAIFVGQLLVNTFKPGVGADLGLGQDVEEIVAAGQSIPDLLLRIIPVNIFEELSRGNVLPIIFFCILFGYFILQLKEPYQSSLSTFIEGAFRVMMKMVHFVIWFAPIGVFGINAKLVGTTGLEAFKSLGFYFILVLVGLFIHAAISLPLLLRLVRVNPYSHYKGMIPALLTAFSTSSSMATLPLNIDCVTTRSRVSEKIAGFTLPIGATVNMDGTALYECVAAIFIAQVYGIELTVAQQGIVVLTALLASIGAAAVPMAGLVMLSIILQALGMPLEGVGIIIAVDRVLDMFRTSVNVLSDSCGAVIIARSEGESLEKMGEPAEQD